MPPPLPRRRRPSLGMGKQVAHMHGCSCVHHIRRSTARRWRFPRAATSSPPAAKPAHT